MATAVANAESANRGIGETYKPGKAGDRGRSLSAFHPFVPVVWKTFLPIVGYWPDTSIDGAT